MKRASLFVSALFLVGTVAGAGDLISGGIAPQTEVIVGDPQHTYGTASLTIFTIPSVNFTVRNSATEYQTAGGIDRFLTAGGAFDAAAMLPNGSQIERLELRACDTNPAAQVSVALVACGTMGGGCTLAGTVGTGTAATPGCNNFSTLPTPVVVNNETAPIVVEVTTGNNSATTFSAVKLYYRLRISPAPGSATFPNDVPTTHAFFRFVEALAAAGVTGGCGPGAYCPDAAVTRGQMAVFLATALGLHFPN